MINEEIKIEMVIDMKITNDTTDADIESFIEESLDSTGVSVKITEITRG